MISACLIALTLSGTQLFGGPYTNTEVVNISTITSVAPYGNKTRIYSDNDRTDVDGSVDEILSKLDERLYECEHPLTNNWVAPLLPSNPANP